MRGGTLAVLAVASAALLPTGSAGGAARRPLRAAQSSCASLGALTAYEVFVAGKIDVTNNQLLGAAAAARNIRMSSYGVSAGLAADPARLDLIAGGDLDVSNAHSNGSVRYGGTLTGSITVPPGGSVAHGPYPFSFAEEAERMQLLSSAWGELAGIEVKKPAGEVLALKGEAAGLNVFHVTSAVLQSVRSITISVPAGASALIDVSGPAFATSVAGAYGAGNASVPAIWNFTQATSVQISGLDFYGTVLAPNAAVTASNGQIHGAVWAHDWEGSGTVLHGSLPGCMPPLPAPALELASLCVDPQTDQLAMRLRNSGQAERTVSWHDEESAQSGTIDARAGTDNYFHVDEGSKPHLIVASSGGETVRAQGTTAACQGTIRVHKSISGTGTPPPGPWRITVSGTSGYSSSQDVTAGGSVDFTVPGTYEAGSAPIGSDPGGYDYTVTEEDPRGAVATVEPELVTITNGQSAAATVENRYEPDEPDVEPGPAPEPPAPLPDEPPLPPISPAGGAQGADLAITQQLSPSRVQLGAQVLATVHIRNLGTLPATGVLASELPQANPLHPDRVAGVLSVSALAGSCTRVRPVTCRLGTLQPGADIVVRARVKPLITGPLTSIVRVTSQTPDLNTTNNIAAAGLVVVRASTRLSVTVSAPARSAAGAPFSYRVGVRVGHAAAAREVRLCQRPTAGLLIASAPGTFRWHGSICRDFHRIRGGASAGFTVSAVAEARAAGRTLALPAAATAPGLAGARGRDTVAIVDAHFKGNG